MDNLPRNTSLPRKTLAPGAEKPAGICRVLISSDWHGDKSTMGFPRFDDVTGSAERAADLAIELRCDWFGFLGDLADPDPNPSHRCTAFAIKLADRLRANGVASFWLGGNHDAVEDGTGSTTLDGLAAHAQTYTTGPGRPQLVQVFTTPRRLRLAPGVQLYALPHPHRGNPYNPEEVLRELHSSRELLWDFASDKNECVLVAGHLEVDGYDGGSETHDMPRGRPGKFPVATCKELWGDRAVLVNGHYHRSHGARDPVMVPGSIERLTRSEVSHQPRVMVLDLPTGGA